MVAGQEMQTIDFQFNSEFYQQARRERALKIAEHLTVVSTNKVERKRQQQFKVFYQMNEKK